MKTEHKEWIDSASYTQLLSKWRSAPMGHPLFMDDTGEYYAKIMEDKRKLISEAEHVRTSKSIGW